MFRMALDSIMTKLKAYEADCDKKGLKIEKYGHLDKIAEEEQAKIVQLNVELLQVDRAIKECQSQYKQLVKKELEDLQETKNQYKQKFEESKQKSRELMAAIDDFKKRFIQQSKQLHSNKERHK